MSEAQTNPPISKLATGAAGVTLVALALPILGILGIHAGALAPMTGFSLFGAGALLGSLAALILGLLGLIVTRGGRDPEGRKRAQIGAIGGAALLGAVFLVAAPGFDFPPINDITTNLADPPAFAGDPSGRNGDMTYPEDWKPLVAEAYPDLQPLQIDEGPDPAFARALATAQRLGWDVRGEDPGRGTIEASSRTAVFQFVDDVVIRVRPDGNGSQIDIRSKSRDGQGDLGANANRIRAFFEAF